MKVLICSEDVDVIRRISLFISQYTDFETVVVTKSSQCIAYLSSERIDMVMISLLGGTAGCLKIMNYLKISGINTVVYLIGKSEEDSVYVYRYKCDGFILKSRIETDMEDCIGKFMLLSKRVSRVRAVTFGRLDIYIDGTMVEFSNRKSKELLGLCIDRCGGSVSIEEATDKLWFGREYDSRVKCLYRKAVMNLNAVFEGCGVSGAFISGRGYCHINKDMFDCDYFKFLEAPERCRSFFGGVYMFEYSWAEETLARLEKLYGYSGIT